MSSRRTSQPSGSIPKEKWNCYDRWTERSARLLTIDESGYSFEPSVHPTRAERRRMAWEQFEQKEQRRRDHNMGEGRGASLRSLRINQEMTVMDDVDEVLSHCRAHMSEFTLINTTTAMHRIAKLEMESPGSMLPCKRHQLEDLLQCCEQWCSTSRWCSSGSGRLVAADVRGQELAAMLWSLARLELQGHPLLEAVLSPSFKKMDEFGPATLSSLSWALAAMGVVVLTRLMASAEARDGIKAQHMSNISWAFATLVHLDISVMDALARAAICRIAELAPENYAMLAWSYATLELRMTPLLGAIAGCSSSMIEEFGTLDIMHLMWAFAPLTYPDDHLTKAFIEYLPKSIYDYDPMGLSNIAWSMACLRTRHPPLMAAFTSCVAKKIHLLDMQHLAQIPWSLTTLGLHSELRQVRDAFIEAVMCKASTMKSPNAHAILWSFWCGSHVEQVWSLFTDIAKRQVGLYDINPQEVLFMDSEWRKDTHEAQLTALLEQALPLGSLQAVVSRLARPGAAWGAFNEACGVVRVRRASSLADWSPFGSEVHWSKLSLLVDHVDGGRSGGRYGCSPEDVLRAMEDFAHGHGQWLKVAGGYKADLLESSVRHAPRGPCGLLIELGAFIGYTAIRLGGLIAHGKDGQDLSDNTQVDGTLVEVPASNNGHLVTVEVEPVQACISRYFIDAVHLSHVAELWVGQVKDVLPRFMEEFGAHSVRFAFFDYKGTIFHEDLATIELLALPAPHAHILADNVITPGAPLFLWYAVHSEAWHTTVWSLNEFLEPDVVDWMVAASYVNPNAATPIAAPTQLKDLSWFTDHMRRRSEGARPAEGLVRHRDRLELTRRVLHQYHELGLEAIPWCGTSARPMNSASRA